MIPEATIIAEARRIAQERYGRSDDKATMLVLASTIHALSEGTGVGFLRLKPGETAPLKLKGEQGL